MRRRGEKDGREVRGRGREKESERWAPRLLTKYRNREQRELIYFTSRTHTGPSSHSPRVRTCTRAAACTSRRLPVARLHPCVKFLRGILPSSFRSSTTTTPPCPSCSSSSSSSSLPLTPCTLGRTETAEPCGVFWSWQLRWRCNNFNNDLSDLPSSPSLFLSLWSERMCAHVSRRASFNFFGAHTPLFAPCFILSLLFFFSSSSFFSPSRSRSRIAIGRENNGRYFRRNRAVERARPPCS